ncbi:lycopene cyclase domain-containing protein [Candidatus Chrysopegis kryptomonas]|uniref:lycopene cyclase domain-containing protein n=1 Tax=Candidatus Chryseopegocella kryptomonas TaxID=1633643 RepID=UPI00228630FA|nr:lycopene cyclase domain-containing protein [Candidatus Chrysopegis kryptomonas]
MSFSLIYFLFAYSDSNFLRYFFIEYILIIPGFLLSNGVLTGSFIVEEPIVFYNPQHHIGIRVFNIPIEDFFYGMLMLIWVSFLSYEKYKKCNELC